MLLFLLPLPLVAIVCLVLGHRLPTRWLGFGAAGAMLLSLGLLLVGPGPMLAPLTLLLQLTLLVGGTLALLALALTIAPTVRGFGALFGWSLLALTVALHGVLYMVVTQPPVLASKPFLWGSAALLAYAAVRASGTLRQEDNMPQGVTMGLLASLLLLGAQLNMFGQSGTELLVPQPQSWAVIGVALASLLLVGGAPFQSTLNETTRAPAALGGLLFGLVFPLLAFGMLLNELLFLFGMAPQFGLESLWRWGLLLLGVFSFVACAAGALRTHSLRRLLGWHVGAQSGAVLLAAGLDGPLALLAAAALLTNLALTTLAGALAVAVVERLTGSDDYTVLQADSDLRAAGALWAVMTLSALGLPGVWGFWGRLWLFELGLSQALWIIPPLLLGSGLLALAYMAPLARFWQRHMAEQRASVEDELPAARTGAFAPLLLVAALLLLVPGVTPQLLWSPLLEGIMIQSSPPVVPYVFPAGLAAQVLSPLAALVLLVLLALLARSRSQRRSLPEYDVQPVVLAPDLLGDQLAPLAGLGQPTPLLRRLWWALRQGGEWARTFMSVFEQRFYLAGVLIALISLILLLAQG